MQSRINGTTMPVLEFILDPNDSIISEAGELSWMSSSIQMTTHTQFGGGGGLFGVIKRVAGGGSIFMTEYRAVGGPGELAFATKLPGHIVPVEVSPGPRIHDSPPRISLRDARRFKSALASSSRWARASSAETVSFYRRSADREPPGSNFPENW